MSSATLLRRQIESALANRIPSALTPAPRILRPVLATGIQAVDELLEGGLPLGAITEVVGPEGSGHTSFALSFLARVTQSERVSAWIDVSDTLDPESVAAAGVDLSRFLWVRCGVQPASHAQPAQRVFSLPEKYLIPPTTKKGLHGGGFGSHPRNEVKGLSDAVSGLLQPEAFAPRCAEPQRKERPRNEVFKPNSHHMMVKNKAPAPSRKPWGRIEEALRVADLLLQGGGFSAIIIDLGSIAPEFASRVPLATWFRYRGAADQTQASVLLLTQHPCAKSSAELLLRLRLGNALDDEASVFTGVAYCVEVARQRFMQVPGNVVSIRKPPQRATAAKWQSRAIWAGPR